MRVMMLTPYPSGSVSGGVEAAASVLIPALARCPEVERLEVVSFSHGKEACEATPLNCRTVHHRISSSDRFELVTRVKGDVLRTRRLLAGIQPDLVHAQGLGREGFIATRLMCPSVVTVHGMVHLERRMRNSKPTLLQRLRIAIADRYMQTTLRGADLIISISDYDKRVLGAERLARVVSIPNPVSTDFLETPGLEKGLVVLFVGLLLPRKNVVGIVRAFSIVKDAVPDAHLRIVGPSPDLAYLTHLEELIKNTGVGGSIELMGHVSQEDLVSLYSGCSVFILFSHEETSPVAVAQAMAVGKPVVASNVGGISEMVVDGYSGYLVPRNDEQLLASRIVELLKDRKLRERMSQRSREVARERYRPESVARQTIQAYRSVLGG